MKDTGLRFVNFLLHFVVVLCLALACRAQGASNIPNTISIQASGAPSGACGNNFVYTNSATNDFYNCVAGAWNKVTSAGGGSVSLTATAPVVMTPSPTTGTGVASCPTCTTATTPTAHGVILGAGSQALGVTAAGTTGQVLTGVTGADPVWATSGPTLINFLCGNHADGAGATWTCASRRNVTSGDVLIAGCSGFLNDSGVATTTIADTLTNSWTRIGTEYFESSPQTYHITAFRTTAGSSGADTITCTSTNASTSFTGSFLISVLNFNSVDVSPGGNSGSNGFGDSLALTTTAANDLCLQWQAGSLIVPAGTSSQIYNGSNGVALSRQTMGPAGTYVMTTMSASNFGNITFCLK